MRILAIGHSYVIAANRSLIRQVGSDPDFEVTVAAPKFFHGDYRAVTIEDEPADSRLEVVGLKARRTKYVHVFGYPAKELRQLVREGGYDVVHAWEEPYIYAGYQIARALQPTQTRFCFRTAQSYVKRYPPPFNLFERVTRTRAQSWIAGGKLVYETMLKRGYDAEQGRILTLAVDTKAFKVLKESERTEVLCELGLVSPVIGFVGRLTEAKGLDVLMAVLDMIGDSVSWNLLLLGSGEYESKILRWAQSRGFAERVRIKLAKHDDVPRYLGAMDVLCAPSQTMRNWREQFGRMIVEAFACGVPVIGSDSGEIPFVVGDAGLIVAEKDVAAWAQAIKQLLTDTERRESLKRKGLERVKRYSVPVVAEEYKEFYRWLSTQPCPSLEA